MAQKVAEAQLNLTDVTTANVSSTAHGFTPKSPADATQFLNGAATPAFAQVKGSDLSMSDVTTNNVSTSMHGFAPKAPNDATKFLNGTGAWSVPSGGGGGSSTLTYDQITTNVTVTATTEAGATTIVTATAHTFDGSTTVMIEFFCPSITSGGSGDNVVELYADGSAIGLWGEVINPGSASNMGVPVHLFYRTTPSNASHTYSVRGWKAGSGSFTVTAGAGGSGAYMPAYIRIFTV